MTEIKDFYESGKGDRLIDPLLFPREITEFLRCEKRILETLSDSFDLLVEVGSMYGRYLKWAVESGKRYFGVDVAKRYIEVGRRIISDSQLDSIKYRFVLGGAGLMNFVQANSKIPAIGAGPGVCHVFVDKNADLEIAVNIVYNAKVSRPAVCNALDTLVVDQKIVSKLLNALGQKMAGTKVEIFADTVSYKILQDIKYPYLQKAKKTDFGREFLSLKMAVKVVKNIDEALKHIGQHSTKHSEAIVTANLQKAQKFLKTVDAACVYHNASTRFTDGSQFGLGGEIGISTQKMHARGPMSIKELTTYKWLIKGNGQIR